MIELLGQRVESKITKEVKKATAHLRGSGLEKEASGPKGAVNNSKVSGKSGLSDGDFEKIEILMRDKANKFDMEMSLR